MSVRHPKRQKPDREGGCRQRHQYENIKRGKSTDANSVVYARVAVVVCNQGLRRLINCQEKSRRRFFKLTPALCLLEVLF